MNEIRILSLWQPWATLIALRLKQYETRSWGTEYRGKLAIHAAKRPVDSEGFMTVRKAFDLAGRDFKQGDWIEKLQFGCIVAIVDLVDCKVMASDVLGQMKGLLSRQIYIQHQTNLERAVGDWQDGRHAWKLENIRPIAHPIPYKGSQGLRTITDEAVLQAIAEQMALTDSIDQQLQSSVSTH